MAVILREFDENPVAVINPEMGVQPLDNFPDVTVSCFSSRQNPHGTLNHSSGSAKRRPPCQKTIISQ